ncbi:MAG: transketolase, partial [Thermoleophilia bacterium]|nr:transketolase [Thermoleophilia bacterium]
TEFNTTASIAAGNPLVDHYTYVIASDGDIMEGVQAEAASLAGHLALSRLIVFWDDNRITIDGTTDASMSEDVAARYRAYGWNVLHIDDVDDLDSVDAAIAAGKAQDKPTFVVTRTHIGIGSPLVDSPKAHGAPLGADNIVATKRGYGWPEDAAFLVPDQVRTEFARLVSERAAAYRSWSNHFNALRAHDEQLAAEFERRISGRLPEGWDIDLDELARTWEGTDGMATRQSSAAALNAVAGHLPELVGGSADLAGSDLATVKGAADITAGSYGGRNIHYGIREHAMGAIMNGMLAHGGVRPFGGTFLIFSDYMRPAIRLAALMGLPATYVFTHDSIYLGEDGPTHQPIEHLASLRAMPGLIVMRPAEAIETAHAWRVALGQNKRPVALALSRQKLATLGGAAAGLNAVQVERGAYVLRDASTETPELILIGSGSEVELCLAAAEKLEESGFGTRVVSMPSWELFLDQDPEYRAEVLPVEVAARVSVEAGATFGWHRWVGDAGDTVGIDRFGMSAPAEQAAAALGLSV